MNTLIWIVASGIAMGLIALAGGVLLMLRQETVGHVLLPLVAFAAGSLIGGALFHMVPASIEELGNSSKPYVWIVAGFLTFLGLEQFLNWHHSHDAAPEAHQPLTYLILIADGFHNFSDGAFVAASFLVDIRLGITAWLTTAAHELPQELGDCAVLLHGGWSTGKALLLNFLSAMTFLVGGLVIYSTSGSVEFVWLIPFAAGSFLYIGAADLIPQIKSGASFRTNVIHFVALTAGLSVLLLMRLVFPHRH
jgi:zinc and cadmium transporter